MPAWKCIRAWPRSCAAYEEIGDKEGARELLEEVMRGGNDAQVARAKSMIAALG